MNQDHSEAVKWFRLGAEQGHAQARKYLEELLRAAPEVASP